MLPLEHSAIRLTCIKRQSVLKTNFCVLFSGRLRQALLYFTIECLILAVYLLLFAKY